MCFYHTEKGKTLMRENIRETQALFTQCSALVPMNILYITNFNSKLLSCIVLNILCSKTI